MPPTFARNHRRSTIASLQNSTQVYRRVAPELQWTCLSAFLATLSAFSGSNGLDPQLLDQRLFLAIWIETAAIRRSRVARRNITTPRDLSTSTAELNRSSDPLAKSLIPIVYGTSMCLDSMSRKRAKEGVPTPSFHLSDVDTPPKSSSASILVVEVGMSKSSYSAAKESARWLDEEDPSIFLTQSSAMLEDGDINPLCPRMCFSEEELTAFFKPIKVLERSFPLPVVQRRLESL
ncbi:hypothetical protein LINPERPRIM_LOCUS33158 [Linum perenne]